MNIIRRIYRYLRPVVVKGKNNKVLIESKLNRSAVRIFGDNNVILIEKNCIIHNSNIVIVGNNCRIHLGECFSSRGSIDIQANDNSEIIIGKNSALRGVKLIASGAKIEIGERCLFSYGIIVRNSDGHSVLGQDGNQLETAINPPKDIVIGNHVWVCENVAILKGVHVGDNSILAYGSVVTKDVEPNSIVAGNPAKAVKYNINWKN